MGDARFDDDDYMIFNVVSVHATCLGLNDFSLFAFLLDLRFCLGLFILLQVRFRT